MPVVRCNLDGKKDCNMKYGKLLLLGVALSSLFAQAQSPFFDHELVANGDASNGTTSWIANNSDAWKSGGIEVHTYSDAGLTNYLPAGKTASDKLFTGQFNQGFFNNIVEINTASYQTITIPTSAYADIDAGFAMAHASALLGGVSDQNDNATVIFSFKDGNGATLSTITLGPVTSGDRNNQSAMLMRSDTQIVPAGTRTIRVDVEMRETSVGDNTNGYADDISLRVEKLTTTVTTDRTAYRHGETVTINYENAPKGCTVELYKELAALPMKSPVSVGDANRNSGSVTATLDPGHYTARIMYGNHAVASSNTFFVDGKKLTEGKRFVVLSDIHVMAPSLVRASGQAYYNRANGELKLIGESEEILAALTDSILHIAPDYVFVTGDLTMNGERESHEVVVSYLQQMKQAGITVFVIPGNHDCNNPNAVYFDGDATTYAPAITRDEFRELYHDFGYGNGIRKDPNSLSYICQIDDKLILVAIDSNRDEENTLINWGAQQDSYHNAGRVKPETLEWLEEQLEQVKEGNRAAVAMMHHHLVPHFDKEKSLISSYIIDDYETVRQLLVQYGVHVIFTGHLHVSDISSNGVQAVRNLAPARAASTAQEQSVTVGDDTMIEIATGSAISYPMQYREFTINENNTMVDVTTHNLTTIGSNPDIAVKARQQVTNNLSSLLNTVSAKAYDIILQKVDEKAGILGDIVVAVVKSVVTLDKVKANVQTYLGETAAKAYTTFSEGGENSKYTDALKEELQTGIYALVYNTLPSIAQGLTDDLVASVMPEAEPLLASMIDDKNNVGTDNECQINDLQNTIVLPLKIPTVITDSPAQLLVKSILYYDLTGHVSDQPFNGVNIVVTTYTNGTQSAQKIIH